MFHHMTDGERHPQIQGALTADELYRILHEPKGVRFLPAVDWLDRYRSGRLAPDEVCITFDDALKSQYEIARPVLDRHGLTAFWFVYSSVFEGHLELFEVHRFFRNAAFPSIADFCKAFTAEAARLYPEKRIEEMATSPAALAHLSEFGFYDVSDRKFRYVRDHVLSRQNFDRVMLSLMASHGYDPARAAANIWMTDDDLIALAADGHLIGLHSYSHPVNLRQMTMQEQIGEYWRNGVHLTRVLGRPPQVMSHPSNSYDDNTLTLLAGMNVDVGFRSNAVLQTSTPLELSRLDHKLFNVSDRRLETDWR